MGYVRTHGHCRYLGWRWRFEDVRFLFPFLFFLSSMLCLFFLLRSTVRKRKGAAALTLTLIEPTRVALCQSCRADMRAISLQCQVCHVCQVSKLCQVCQNEPVVADRLRAPKKRHVCLLRVCGVSYSLVVYNRRSSLSAASAVSRCSAEARGFLTLPERWWAARPSTSRPGTPGTDTRVRSTHVARVRVHVVRMSKLRTYVIRMYVAVCRFTQGTFVFVSLVLSVIQGMNPRQHSFWKSGLCWLKNQHRLA